MSSGSVPVQPDIGPAHSILPARQRTPASGMIPRSAIAWPVLWGAPCDATVTSWPIFFRKRSTTVGSIFSRYEKVPGAARTGGRGHRGAEGADHRTARCSAGDSGGTDPSRCITSRYLRKKASGPSAMVDESACRPNVWSICRAITIPAIDP